jgi:hypothetical protein
MIKESLDQIKADEAMKPLHPRTIELKKMMQESVDLMNGLQELKHKQKLLIVNSILQIPLRRKLAQIEKFRMMIFATMPFLGMKINEFFANSNFAFSNEMKQILTNETVGIAKSIN